VQFSPLTRPHAAQIYAAALLASLLAGCAGLPPLDGRSESRSIAGTSATSLGRAVEPRVAEHPGKSGFHALTIPAEAFAARGLLATAAEKSLDVQYYIWHGDQTGYLMFEAIWKAAQRGVRVRILLDDANTGGLDATLAALDAHPNIEVRLYNPLMHRHARALDFITDFTRVNRRMHNKSFTADGQVTIVGGRNIGDEYAGAQGSVDFADLDVVAVGPAVREVSSAFDLYWNSASAYPIASIVPAAGPGAARDLEGRFADVRADPDASAYVDALNHTQLVADLVAGQLPLEWTDARLVRDDPGKTLDAADRRDLLLLSQLLPIMGEPSESFDLVSPYFVPGEAGTAALARMAQRGVAVRVLTNSQAATDVAPVHSGYARRRCDLLRAGVHLFELKPAPADRTPPGSIGSSAAVQLHAKTWAIERRRVFVGSFNFDERSAYLNTEMGLVIESPALARRLSGSFDDVIPQRAYEVRIGADGQCPVWIERGPGGEIQTDVEPATGAIERAWVRFLGVLPIEWLL
jgi:putative cardiolipin synthase